MPKIINVYINGTDESSNLNSPITSLANVLHAMTVQDEQQRSICLEGCAVNNTDIRDLSVVFTFRLEAQIDLLVKEIRQELSSATEKLTLNLYGFSRGGAATFWISTKLKDISLNKLEINICSFEPVPGNFIRASYIDTVSGIKSTLSSRIADLSDCKNMNNILVLYTNEPMLDVFCHGPILPIVPAQAKLKVDVLPGCHKDVERFNVSQNSNLTAHNKNSAITFHYVTRFLKTNGTIFNETRFTYHKHLKPEFNLVELLKSKMEGIHKTERAMHFHNTILSTPEKKYLNLLHKELVIREDSHDAGDCTLSVKEPLPKPSYWREQISPTYTYFPLFAKAAAPLLKRTLTAAGAAYSYAREYYQHAKIKPTAKKISF